MNQNPIILTDGDKPVVKIEPGSKMWRKIRRQQRKQRYIPGNGTGCPVATGEVVEFKSGNMLRFTDGSLRRSDKYEI